MNQKAYISFSTEQKRKDWKVIFIISKLWYYVVVFLISKNLSGMWDSKPQTIPTQKQNVCSSSAQNTTGSYTTFLGLQTKPLLNFFF